MNDDVANPQPGDNPLTFEELVKLRYDLTLDLYRRKAREEEVALSKDKDTLQYYAYEVFGSDLMASIALALDPYWQFADPSEGGKVTNHLLRTVYPVRVAKGLRTRKRQGIWPQPILFNGVRTTEVYSSHPVNSGGSWSTGPLAKDSSTQTVYKGTVLGTQQSVLDTITDSTYRTRNGLVSSGMNDRKLPKVGKQQKSKTSPQSVPVGPLELFKSSISSSGESFSFPEFDDHTYQLQAVVGPHGESIYTQGITKYHRSGTILGPGATVSASSVSQYLTSEKLHASTVMSQKVIPMFQRVLPTGRMYNLGYQMGELKDIPQQIHGILNAVLFWRRFEQRVGTAAFIKLLSSPSAWTWKNVELIQTEFGSLFKHPGPSDKRLSNWYLSFKFGWQSLYQAITQFLSTPASISKKVNTLIRRNGKDQTFRSSIKWIEPNVTSFPAVSILLPPLLNNDVAFPASSVASKSVELRIMLNCKINFPTVDIPNLRKKLWSEISGETPTPGDIYDWIPWTWLLDWFGGLGEYIHLMDALNSDNFLINYGFLTYKSVLTVTASAYNYGLTNRTIHYIGIPGATNVSETFRNVVPRSALYTGTYQIRKSLGDFAGVKLYTGSGMSPTQYSILAALFHKFS